MVQHRAIAFAALCLLALETLTGCKDEIVQEEYPRSETLYLGGFIEKSKDWPAAENCPLIFETLFLFNESANALEPLLAQGFSQATNSIEIKLNPKAHFSDGEKVSSDDVIFALQNAAPAVDVSLGDEGSILIAAKDAKHWNPALVKDLLIHVLIKPQHPHAQGELLGSGPYIVSKIFPNKVVFALNEHYWAGSSHLPKFIIHSDYNSAQHLQHALSHGYLDIAQGLESKHGLDLVFEHKSLPWSNTVVRKAAYLALHSSDSAKDFAHLAFTSKSIAFLLKNHSYDSTSQTLLYQGADQQGADQQDQAALICKKLSLVGIPMQAKKLDSIAFATAISHHAFSLALVARPWDASPSAHWRRIHQTWVNEGTDDSPMDPKAKAMLETLTADNDSSLVNKDQQDLAALASQLVPSIEITAPSEPTLTTSTEHWSMPAHFGKICTRSLQAMQAKRLDLKQ